MLTTYFKRQTTRATYYSGPAGPYLDEFTDWLVRCGYQQDSIRRRLQGAVQLATWAKAASWDLPSLERGVLADFRRYLSKRGQLLYSSGQRSAHWHGARLFLEFLQAQQIMPPVSDPVQTARPPLLRTFEEWMQIHRGVKPATLRNYRHHLIDLLATLGESPEQFDAGRLRTFLLSYAERHSRASAKMRVKALRAFLRFLIATERCEPRLETAIPSIAEWRLSTLPRYLSPQDVERVITACDDTTAIGIRDKAIVVLLARLGLRAGEVANLKLNDIDWSQGAFTVIGKSRREARLPLPQDVGDAMLHYLNAARPAINSNAIFITAIAPWTPIASNTVSSVAALAIRRAGIEAPSFGAHVLRHSAATGWLSQGASLQVIGEVLRHRDTATTAHYAKVDLGLLEQVVRPWPGAAEC